MKSNQDYKNAALEALRGNWPVAVVTVIVYMAIVSVCSAPSSILGNGFLPFVPEWVVAGTSGASLLLTVLFLAPLLVGYYNTFNRLYQEGNTDIVSNLFTSGFRNWGHIVGGQLLMAVYIFLWCLLLIVPGIVKAYSYAMTPYILVDRPELSANEAISLSCRMMKGRKFDLFYLQLSFIGWALLCVITLGIGFLWLSPYMMTAQAAFYQDVKADYEMQSVRA